MARNSTGSGSKQDYGTPRNLMRAVWRKFGPHSFDLAAHAENTKHARFFTPEEDSLAQRWHAIPGLPSSPLLWLNPPFADIAPWAKKARGTVLLGDVRIAFLTPASVGAQWFSDHVWSASPGPAPDVYFLLGRLTFEGAKDPYPKDCMLTLFSPAPQGIVDVWDWRKDSAE